MDNINSSLEKNISYINERLKNCDDVIKRKFSIGINSDIHVYMIYTDNIVSGDVIQGSILTNLMNRAEITSSNLNQMLTKLQDQAISVGEVKEIYMFEDLFTSVLLGDTVLLMEGNSYGVVISTKGWPTRGVPQAETEVVVQGPKDAFVESVSTNVVLVRRRIRDTRLKVKRSRIGVRSKTDVALLYIDDIVRKDVLEDITNRLQNLDVDCILDSGYMEQLIEKDWMSPFPQMQLTERPDKTAAALYEGRVAVVVDNTPFVLLLPSTLNVFFQAAEDYYDRWQIMSFMRVLRYCAAVLAVSLPGLYIALTVYHPSMIPTALALKIAGARMDIPFPALVEVLIMEIAFELLREAGIRLPAPVSSTIGIVGGIIIGQAAVEAGIVGPIVVIVGALTGICTFVIPNPSLVSGLRISKYLVIFLSALMGLYGFWLALLILLIHLADMKSFGFPYLYPFCSGSVNDYSDLKDSIFRVPTFLMKKRPIFANPEQRIRMKDKEKKKGDK